MTGSISLRSRVAGAALRRYREAIGYQLEDAARVLDCDQCRFLVSRFALSFTSKDAK